MTCLIITTPLWPKRNKIQQKWPSNHLLSHQQGSEPSERTSERASAAERASKASNGKEANQRANKRTQASGPVLTSGFTVDLAHSAPPYAALKTFPINTNSGKEYNSPKNRNQHTMTDTIDIKIDFLSHKQYDTMTRSGINQITSRI